VSDKFEVLNERAIDDNDKFIQKAFELLSRKEPLKKSEIIYLLNNYLYPRDTSFSFNEEEYKKMLEKPEKLKTLDGLMSPTDETRFYEVKRPLISEKLSSALDSLLIDNQDLIFELVLNEISQIRGAYHLIDIMRDRSYDGSQISSTLERIKNEPWLDQFIDYLRKLHYNNKSDDAFWHSVYKAFSYSQSNE
jgi:hypothetical protein